MASLFALLPYRILESHLWLQVSQAFPIYVPPEGVACQNADIFTELMKKTSAYSALVL